MISSFLCCIRCFASPFQLIYTIYALISLCAICNTLVLTIVVPDSETVTDVADILPNIIVALNEDIVGCRLIRRTLNINRVSRDNTTRAFLSLAGCVLYSNSELNITVLADCSLLELLDINAILQLECNSPKTITLCCISCTCSTSDEFLVWLNTLNVNKLIKLLALRVDQRDVSWSQLSICRRYTNYERVCNCDILVICRELNLCISKVLVSRELSCVLTWNPDECQIIVWQTTLPTVCISLVEVNSSNHCCVLTDDVLQLSLNVCNLSSETELSVIVLNTVQYALDKSQTRVK